MQVSQEKSTMSFHPNGNDSWPLPLERTSGANEPTRDTVKSWTRRIRGYGLGDTESAELDHVPLATFRYTWALCKAIEYFQEQIRSVVVFR